MRLPCTLDFDPDGWLTETDEDPVLIALLKQHLDKVILFADQSLAGKARMVAADMTYRGEVLQTFLNTAIVFTARENLQGLFPLNSQVNGHGVLTSSWQESFTQTAALKFRARLGQEGLNHFPLDLHFRLANRIDLIDPFCLIQATEDSHPLLNLDRLSTGDIHVYTTLGVNRYKSDIQNNWSVFLDSDLSPVGPMDDSRTLSLCRDQAKFEQQGLLQLQLFLKRLSLPAENQNWIIHVYRRDRFPHDRHISFSFPTNPGNGQEGVSIDDYFALGDGLKSLDLALKLGQRSSQIYHSDIKRMWNGFGQEIRTESHLQSFIRLARSKEWHASPRSA